MIKTTTKEQLEEFQKILNDFIAINKKSVLSSNQLVWNDLCMATIKRSHYKIYSVIIENVSQFYPEILKEMLDKFAQHDIEVVSPSWLYQCFDLNNIKTTREL